MTGHIDAQLAELLFGDVSAEDCPTLEAHAAECARCGRALADAREDFSALGWALAPEAPPPELRARILAAAKPRTRQFLLDKIATIFDVSRDKALALLAKLEDPDAWQGGPVESSWLLFVDEAGPLLEGAFCSFVKLDPDVQWPEHRHLGREQMLVLEGGFRETDGHEVHPGELRVMEAGSAHGFSAFAHAGCLSAAIVYDGVELLDLMEPEEASARAVPSVSEVASGADIDDARKR
ncbi:MAG TPA: cupin domain-containing protein [Polyangia bacterium]|nr:cupin domain-containing protein [Polyangia bacterium]